MPDAIHCDRGARHRPHNMNKINTIAISAFLAIGTSFPAHADLVTFDDLDGSIGTEIPDGYKGLSWERFFTLDPFTPLSFEDEAIEYAEGLISAPNIAYNGFGDDAAISSDTEFSVASLYLTAAFTEGLTVTLQGIDNVGLKFEKTVVLSTSTPLFVELGFNSINELEFEVLRFPGITGTQFVVDNLLIGDGTLTAVPEPSTYALGSLMLLGGVMYLRRRSKSAAAAKVNAG